MWKWARKKSWFGSKVSYELVDNLNTLIKEDNSLENSVNSVVRLIAPLIDASKQDIVKIGIDLQVPFELIHSCYVLNDKHCGKCESCVRLKRALEQNNSIELIQKIF